MITLRVKVPYGRFRKSFARSYAETYPLPPPATIYGMLLSLVGERFRRRHEGVRLAFAFRQIPRIATNLSKLSRYKYGVPGKQSKLGNAPDFVEILCGIEFLCWIDSTQEIGSDALPTLERRIIEAINFPDKVNRSGILCLGLSDDIVDEVVLCQSITGTWHRLLPEDTGQVELPIWVDHVGSANTRWNRYNLEKEAKCLITEPGTEDWRWTEILAPQN